MALPNRRKSWQVRSELTRKRSTVSCVPPPALGVLAEGPDGKSQTPMSTALRSNATPSLRSFAIMGGREWHGRGWSHLEYCVRTGKQALDKIYGMHIFDFLKQHPADGQIFHDAMTELSMIDGPAVAEAYNFEGIHSIMDVAGGHGFLLASWRGICICQAPFTRRPALSRAPRTGRSSR